MKFITLCFLMQLMSLHLSAQEQPTGINATFIFFQGKDTLDFKKTTVYITNGSIQFLVKSRVKIKRVHYELTGGPAGGKPVGTLQDFSDQYISFNAISNGLRRGDLISVVIRYLEDEQGKRYKAPKSNYRFTLK